MVKLLELQIQVFIYNISVIYSILVLVLSGKVKLNYFINFPFI